MDATAFHPSLWGDFFVKYKPPTAPKRGHMTERAELLKEEVRKTLKAAANQITNALDLIITLQRLGLDHHYENEISELLRFVYSSSDYDDKDLYVVSLRFYLLRKHGHCVSSDVFTSFKDEEGNFVVDDTKCLLSLYNAAYVRTHGEKVLDEAITFTRRQLEASLLDPLEPALADEVHLTLQTPLFRRLRILEAINYIPIYGKEAGRNEAILELAKLNFNLAQLIYCEELKEVTLWWKQLNVETNLSFIRDRIVECHFWMTGACCEPQYSLSRVIATKMTALITVLDDMMDTYSTTEEAMLLAEAIYSITKESFEWLLTYPELAKSLMNISRLLNDTASTKREQNAGQHVSTVQCYMLKHGTTMDEACEKIKELTEDSWKDMMELYLTPTEHPKLIAQTIVDFARTADYMYKETDGFTFSHTIKDMIAKLFVDPISLF
ncbi:terpene synthase10 [Zea mays]|uniref:(E)-beta-farnesene synthase n=1 Tax=Zea mays TaxID=4577 RepID=A0A1D6IZJ6_MAIZE|nr:terpene synthase10 [Zea mays]